MAGELIEQFDDHEGRVSRFIERWQTPDLQKLAAIYLRQLQDLEDATFEVLLERNLDDSIGVQLDNLGEIVKQPRTTSDDDRYRTAIRARIAINLSESTGEDLIKVAGLMLTDGETFQIRDEPPAQVRVTIFDPLTSADADLMHQLLDAADGAGVRVLLDWNSALATPADKLLFDDSISGDQGGGGFGSTTGAAGTGKFDSVIGG